MLEGWSERESQLIRDLFGFANGGQLGHELSLHEYDFPVEFFMRNSFVHCKITIF